LQLFFFRHSNNNCKNRAPSHYYYMHAITITKHFFLSTTIQIGIGYSFNYFCQSFPGWSVRNASWKWSQRDIRLLTSWFRGASCFDRVLLHHIPDNPGSRVRFFLDRPWWWLNLKTLPDRLHNTLKDCVTNVDGIVTQTIFVLLQTIDIADRSKTNGGVTRVTSTAYDLAHVNLSCQVSKISLVPPLRFYSTARPWRTVKDPRRCG